jgi:hypothetical protein
LALAFLVPALPGVADGSGATCRADVLTHTWTYPPLLHTLYVAAEPGVTAKAVILSTASLPDRPDPMLGKVGLAWVWNRDACAMYVPADEALAVTQRRDMPPERPVISRVCGSARLTPFTHYLFGAFAVLLGEPAAPAARIKGTRAYNPAAEPVPPHPITRQEWIRGDHGAIVSVKAYSGERLVSTTTFSDFQRPWPDRPPIPLQAQAVVEAGGIPVSAVGHQTAGAGGPRLRTVTFTAELGWGKRRVQYRFQPGPTPGLVVPASFRVTDAEDGTLVADCQFRDWVFNVTFPEGFFACPNTDGAVAPRTGGGEP